MRHDPKEHPAGECQEAERWVVVDPFIDDSMNAFTAAVRGATAIGR